MNTDGRVAYRKARVRASLSLCMLLFAPLAAHAQATITGTVFHDLDENGRFDVGEPGIPGVWVSNGIDIAVTDERGRYELAVGAHTVVFVIKPRGWMTATDADNIPTFYAVFSDAGAGGGSFPGLPPTGPRPESVDFGLHPQHEADRFEAIFLADTQPWDLEEIRYIARDTVQELIGTTDAAFGVTLGDVVFDDLSLFEPMNRTIAQIGLPWFYAIGNHDIDFSADNSRDARGAWYRTYGPTWYAFTWGSAHFVVLDNIEWIVTESTRYYQTGIGDDQLEFLAHFLALVPDDELVFVLAHIPWVASTPWRDERQREKLFEILASHPLAVSVTGHSHRHYHVYVGPEYGWPGERPHHLVSVGAVSGSWWSGLSDEYGVPHAMMRDGSPTGYAFLEIDGNAWRLRYQAARRPADFQMHIFIPDFVSATRQQAALVYANVFNALPDARVEMRIEGHGDWQAMTRTQRIDPTYEAMWQRENLLPAVTWQVAGHEDPDSRHLWQIALPDDLPPGVHTVHVRAEDSWDVYTGRQILYVVE